MTSAGLHLENVALDLAGRRLVGPLTLAIRPGEVVALMGESGVGKSSLLAFLCGTLPPAFAGSGRVLVNGADVTSLPPQERRLGILFQDDLLFPHLSVGQNLAFALSSSVRPWSARRSRIDSALAKIGLAGFADRDPATLSGGQRARVSVMRVLLAEPQALLLDEPFSKLDALTRQRFRDFVFAHVREAGLPALMVSHDPDDARAAGGPVVQLPRFLESPDAAGER